MYAVSAALRHLKHELQNEQDSSRFEKLVAALISRLLDVPIAVASSGFQHGADAGPAGQRGRRFRLECKRYSETTRLTPRELRGEIDEALERDEALEAWVLCTTRTVNEQIRQSLDQHGGKNGVPVLIIDWTEVGIPTIAALCASSPELVGEYVTTAARDAARAVRQESGNVIESLRRDLESWCLGFDSLRKDSHNKLSKIWNCPKESNAALGQNAAGGSKSKKVKRKAVHDGLDSWWRASASDDAPAVVLGREGVGKTWATLHWLIDRIGDQPIVLVVPSSVAVSMVSDVSETNVIRLLARRLYELTGVRDSRHWERRLARLLKRPLDEGPVLTVFFDGINQEPSVSWLNLLKVLQGVSFSRRARVIVTTREHHYRNKLSMLKGLIDSSSPIAVGSYDMTPGGELDQMLAYEGLTRDDMHQDVLELTRTPRLFDLVVEFSDQLVEAGQITLHRLLWEYGRDTLGVRAGRSFSEYEWIDWLKHIANQHREGSQTYSLRTLVETVSRPDLTPGAVDARLSEIIDGKFAIRNAMGDLELTPAVIAHALGLALLNHLDQPTSKSYESLDVALKQWLDPITGFDQTAEILRAAVSIQVEIGDGALPKAGVLLTAWLQAQNVTDKHRQEIVALASSLPGALLDVVEYSDSEIQESARHWAVKALRVIPRTDDAALKVIVERTRRWMGTVYLDIDTRRKRSDEQRKWREDHLSKLIGTHSAGTISVVGVKLNLVDRHPGQIKSTVPLILEGFPLSKATGTLEAAVTALAAGDNSGCWEALRWLCLLNEVDPKETAIGLRDLSDNMRRRIPEPGIQLDLPKRVAALLLWLTGLESDDKAATHLNPSTGRSYDYVRDYAANPGRSFLPLERRHAHDVLKDCDLAVQSRVERIRDLWLDPNFRPSCNFVTELRDLARTINVEKLNRSRSRTKDDLNFDELVPALARCAPDLLAELDRRKLKFLKTCPLDSRHWSAVSAKSHFLLSGEAEAQAANTLRHKGRDIDDANELIAANRLLTIEIRNLTGREQVETLIQANLPDIMLDFSNVLRPLTSEEATALIRKYDSALGKQRRDLLKLLAIQPVLLDEYSWSWIRKFAVHEDDNYTKLAFIILNQADTNRFGRELLDGGWSWCFNKHIYVNHYGTDSLIEASSSVSFKELAPRVAPWRLLEAVRRRGADPAEIKVAAAIFGNALTDNALIDLDLGSDISVDLTRVDFLPFSYSVSPRRSENEVEAMQLAFDPDANLQAHRRAIDTAATRIDEARRNGVTLFQAIFDYLDFKPVIEFAPDYVDRWLDGYSEPTAEFENRVHRAEGAYLALCEALLILDPGRGVRLWRVLSETLRTRYVGAAGVDDLLHMAFRVPESPEVLELRVEVAELKFDQTDDRALFDLAIAAVFNDKLEWLNQVIEKDRVSPYAWRRARAMVLEGFRVNNSLPIAEAWPEGELETTNARVTCMSARSRWIEACARHWWNAYLDAADPSTAYAAWVLFLRATDRRSWTWIQKKIDAVSEKDDVYKQKMAHVRLNRDELKRACKEREKELDRNFLYRKIVEGIGPWA